MPTYRYSLLDVFTHTPYAGNALAVFTTAVPAELMQPLAAEIGLSETVFLDRPSLGGTASARIFTPAAELPFAGHPVLGAAILLASRSRRTLITLECAIGPIDVSTAHDRGRWSGTMTQPAPTFTAVPPEPVLAALRQGLESPPMLADNGPTHLLAHVADLSVVPDLEAVAALGSTTFVCHADPLDGRVNVRVYAPAVGVPEDPATGSAAGPLAMHLVTSGLAPFGRLTIEQGVAMGRPSEIEVEIRPGQAPRVGGGAVVIGGGEIRL